MLDTGRIDACFINWGASEESARRHMGLLRRYRNHQSWVIVRCLQRSQGLLVTHSLSDTLELPRASSLRRLIMDTELRWAMRQDDSGSKRLLEDLCSIEGKCITTLRLSVVCDSERSAAAAVSRGNADVCCGVHSTALDFGLPFQPVADVSLDLVMTRKTYFRTLAQDFITRMQDANTHAMANSLGGYTLAPTAQLVTID
jgi:molybdate-binding protein